MTAVAAPSERARAERAGWVGRALAAVPLVSVLTWLALLYVWQAWRVRTPWLFTDELEFAQLARSFAETGETMRRGEPHGFKSLYVFLISPAWLFEDTRTAYETAKYIGAIAMATAVLPAYALARMLVAPRAALFAAAATGVIPAFMYSTLLISETVAYPYATLCLLLIARALTTPRPVPIALAAAASLAAPLVRTQLAVLPVVFVLAALGVAWSGERARRWRSSWSRWDWAGAVLLAIGAVLVFSAVLASLSGSWDVATRLYKGRIVEYGLWAGGALTIGLGVLPVLLGGALLGRARDERRSRELTAFRSLLVASVVAFWVYAGVKAAYLSTIFGTYVYERNLIYLAPLFFVATAVWLERRRVHGRALAAAAAAVGVLLAGAAIQLDYPYFEAPGFAILSEANRDLGWSQALLHDLLFVVLAAAGALVLLVAALRERPRLQAGVVAATAVLVLAWNVTGQVSASYGSKLTSDLLLSNLPAPADWVDRANGGGSTVYLVPQVRDRNGLWLLEFWNRSITKVWSLDPDSPAPGPGPTLTPDLSAADGRLVPDPQMPFALVDRGLDVVGETVTQNGSLRLLRIVPPLRLRSSVTGVDSDGWMSRKSAFSQFSSPTRRGGGTVVVELSRRGWSGEDVPGRVTVRVGSLVVGEDKQAAIGNETAVRTWTAHATKTKVFAMPAPPPPFRVEVTIDKTFRPCELDRSSGDCRDLGVQVGYRFAG